MKKISLAIVLTLTLASIQNINISAAINSLTIQAQHTNTNGNEQTTTNQDDNADSNPGASNYINPGSPTNTNSYTVQNNTDKKITVKINSKTVATIEKDKKFTTLSYENLKPYPNSHTLTVEVDKQSGSTSFYTYNKNFSVGLNGDKPVISKS